MIDRFEQFSSSIASIYKTIQKIKRDEMARYDLKGPHVQCLMGIARHPEGVTLTRLCEICEMDKAAISRSVSELEKKGMIARSSGEEKTYRAPLTLTERGWETARSIGEIVSRAVALAGEGLSDADRAVFYPALDLIAANLRRISREGIANQKKKENEE